MLKGKFALLSIAAAVLLCLQVAGVETASSGNVDPCESTATGSGAVFACLQNDGDLLSATGATITVTVLTALLAPIPGVPAQDIYILSCNDLLGLCGLSGATQASAATDVNGVTTITANVDAGGCDNGGVRVVVQGIVLGSGPCADPCVPVAIRSGDFNNDGISNIIDFGYLTNGGGQGSAYPVNPTVTDGDKCRDFNNDTVVNIVDFGKFTQHYQHVCGG